MFDDKLPLLDLRSTLDYQTAHAIGATHLTWPSLIERINELPARPAKLQVVAEADILDKAEIFLIEKGYEVVAKWDAESFEAFLYQTPKICQAGGQSRVLWQPCGLLKDYVEALSYGLRGKALDIGCGGGRDAVYLAQQGWQVIAIDKQLPVLARAQQLASYHQQSIDFRSCDLSEASCLPNEQFDLILMVRYLNRDSYEWMKQHLAPGGVLIVQTFTEGVEAYSSPKNPNFILRNGELAKTFSEFEIIIDRIEPLKDGRPVASFIAKKRKSK